MNHISKERFEAWLFNQPVERAFHYFNIHECAICSFVRETSNLTAVTGGATYDLIDQGGLVVSNAPIPEWLRGMLARVGRIFTIADLQKLYREMFPEAESETLLAKGENMTIGNANRQMD